MDYNRDFLYVKAQQYDDAVVEKIHSILYAVETISFLSTCVEIIELNKCKILRKKHLVEQVLRQPRLKPFQFINNLN